MKKYFLITAILCGILVSCKKSSSSSTSCPLTEANLAGSYKITAATYKATYVVPGEPTITVGPSDEYNDTAIYKPCQKDDIITLDTAGHVITYVDAGVTCSPPGGYSGTWSLSGSTVTIPIVLTGGIVKVESGTISNFSCTGMVVTVDSVLATAPSTDQAVITYTKTQ
jgi:hypothetical protein